MAGRKWRWYPEEYRQMLEHALAKPEEEFYITCRDKTSAASTRRDLHRYFVLTLEEAESGNEDAARFVPAVRNLMVTVRGTTIIAVPRISTRSFDMNAPMTARAAAAAGKDKEQEIINKGAAELLRRIEQGEDPTDETQPKKKNPSSYY